jgi:hypothetical protein
MSIERPLLVRARVRAARSLLIIAAAAAIGVSLFIIIPSVVGEPDSRARGSFKLSTKENTGQPWPYDFGGISNSIWHLLESEEGRLTLANMSGTGSKNFALEAIWMIRSTDRIQIIYSGRGKPLVQCVTSNAVNMIVRYYATNQSAWEVSYFDTLPCQPKSFGEKVNDLSRHLGRLFSK